jgi:hypothetical protein
LFIFAIQIIYSIITIKKQPTDEVNIKEKCSALLDMDMKSFMHSPDIANNPEIRSELLRTLSKRIEKQYWSYINKKYGTSKDSSNTVITPEKSKEYTPPED